MSNKFKQQLKAYGVAVIAVGVAVVVSRFLRPYQAPTARGSFLLLLAAVAVASWYGGYGPAAVAILLSGLISARTYLEPFNSFKIGNFHDILRFCIFIGVALAIGSLHAARAKAERVMRDAEERLGFALASTGVGCWDAEIKSGRFWRSANLPNIYCRPEGGFSTTYEGFFAYIHPEDRDFVRLATIKSGAGKTDYEIVHRIVCADSSMRWVKTRGQMYLGERGNVERMVGVCFQLAREPAALEKAAGEYSHPT